MRIDIVLLISCLIAWHSCKATNDGGTPVKQTPAPVFMIDLQSEYQEMHGFGASDAWSCQIVGKNWPDEKKNQMADLLFSQSFSDEGNPLGIGLSMWRFNIGGGSAEQGERSDIKDAWRRAECFMDEHRKYNWDKQSGQRWFLQAARERGVEDFTAFLNSPPVALTLNGKAYSSLPDSYNLSSDNYAPFVEYITRVLKFFKEEEGIDFHYISPFNEPQWDWMKPTQEGTPAKNSEIATITKMLNQDFEKNGISTLIEVPEAAKIHYLFKSGSKPNRNNQISSFFSVDSENYIGNLSHVAHQVAGHSYFSTWDFDRLKTVRQELAANINKVDPDLEYCMTEYCILENNKIIKGSGRDLGMEAALYTARVIHADLTYANACNWQWWIAISPYDFKDGLVYIDKDDNKGNVYDSKLLWTLGNYSRFIRPGMKRIAVKPDVIVGDEVDVSAYKTTDNKQVVFVINNYGDDMVEFKINLENANDYAIDGYLTSANKEDNLRHVKFGKADEAISMIGKSVLTVVMRRE